MGRDFYKIKTVAIRGQAGMMAASPEFINRYSRDIMIRDGNFVAVWDPDQGLWSLDEFKIVDLIDSDVMTYVEDAAKRNQPLLPRLCSNDDDGVWRKYRQWVKNMANTDHLLDRKPIFADTPIRQEDYASFRLPYTLSDEVPANWFKLVDTLYGPEDRRKIEWCIGAILTGDSRKIDKFIVFYGAPGTGKSTILNIMQKLFGKYAAAFDSEVLGRNSSNFALSAFSKDPLVAIEHDGDLSRIETNTRLNSIISHETQLVDEKFKQPRELKITTMLVMASNNPVQITSSNSGIARRLVDVFPTGEKRLSIDEYRKTMAGVDEELGEIANHCISVYRSLGPDYYKDYESPVMRSETNVIYDFVSEMYDDFSSREFVTLGAAYMDYKRYAEASGLLRVMRRQVFGRELKYYFREFHERKRVNGAQLRSVFIGFRTERFERGELVAKQVDESSWLDLKPMAHTPFDDIFADRPAQYTSERGTPQRPWDSVTTTLKDIDVSRQHYVRLPEEYVVIDFDLKGDNGEKDLARNLWAASSWTPTFAEVSKSGGGLHLVYRYTGTGDTAAEYSPGIEIKRFRGKASLRRRLSLANDLPIADYTDQLPGKAPKMINEKHIKNESHLRSLIAKALRKEVHSATAPNVDFIKQVLDDAYSSGITYDVTDARNAVTSFAAKSTNQAERCLKVVQTMHFMSEDKMEVQEDGDGPIAFFDVEVFPNLFIICYKYPGKETRRLVNPSAKDVEKLMRLRLIGFNNRKYDNHILYAAMRGYSNEELFELSQRIVNNQKNGTSREAYSVSYTDIYDFSTKKQSLKKWEIELGIHHQELGLPWDKPVPEELWDTVADYCANDVVATEVVFNHLADDWGARQILASLSGLSVNDTTNQHTCALVFGPDRRPDKSKFVYTDLSEMFPGYTFDKFKGSVYRGEDPGEGGYVYSEPGYYENVALLDIASMHPTSIEQLNLFGPYTKTYSELKQARIAIKHKDMEALGKLFNGKLLAIAEQYNLDNLGKALKLPINSMYGLTSARFDNPALDPRNIDNIVAKRGALFMIDLKHYVQDELGLVVAHIKTDSIKIPNATPDDIQKVMDFGAKYGYTFEHEATYAKMVLVNKAVYIARYAFPHEGEWCATGKQFQEPYVFKKLFTKEPIEFEDYVQTKQVQTAMYLRFPDGEQHFVGKVGAFVPIKPEKGGGDLLRENKDGVVKDAVVGTKGYRWKEAEVVKFLHQEQDVDTSYSESLADEAREAIEQFTNFDEFVN